MEIALESSSLKNTFAVSLGCAVVPKGFIFQGEIGQVAHLGHIEEG